MNFDYKELYSNNTLGAILFGRKYQKVFEMKEK